jgi:hypothetical protein
MMMTYYYSNREIDGQMMVQRLRWGRTIPTDRAKCYVEGYELTRSHAISNYKDTRQIERDLGDMRLLLSNRDMWSQEGAFDDCSHWVGEV